MPTASYNITVTGWRRVPCRQSFTLRAITRQARSSGVGGGTHGTVTVPALGPLLTGAVDPMVTRSRPWRYNAERGSLTLNANEYIF